MLHPLEPRRLLAVTYSLIELTFHPNDLSNLDQIAAADNVYQIRRGGRIVATPLPTLARNGRVVATHINDEGTMIGVDTVGQPTGDDLTTRDPVVIARDSRGQYQTRSLRDPLQGDLTDPTNLVAINDNNEILTDGGEGELTNALGDERLFTLGRRGRPNSTAVNDLLLPTETRRLDLPADINNLGQIVGADLNNAIDVLYEFRRGRASIAPATFLSGDTVSDVQKLTAINDAGMIVGNTALATSGRNAEATLYQRSSRGRYYRTFLGRLPDHSDSFATALNNAGVTVGVSFAQPQFGPITEQSAFLYTPGRHAAIQDLNTLITNPGNDHVTRPIAINDAGLIVAEAVSTRNGQQRFVLLLPSESTRVTRSVEQTAAISVAPPALEPALRPASNDDLWQSDARNG
jgi:hypothetical protein